MKEISLLTIVLFFCVGCKNECIDLLSHDAYEYDLVLEDGIYVESFNQEITDENRYNYNNTIYKLCREFSYDYYYEDTEGNQFFMEREKGDEEPTLQEEFQKWSFVPKESPTSRTTLQIELRARGGLEPFSSNYPDYNQTIIKYSDRLENGKCTQRAETGVIENEMNVWIHPPRHGLFAMLELAPFPFIQAPYEVGNTWVFDFVRINGDEWSDPRWLEFEGQINIISTYEITDIITLSTEFGSLECFEITGIARNPHGAASLVSYFNSEYGFVKLEYTNIDSTKVILELVDVKE